MNTLRTVLCLLISVLWLAPLSAQTIPPPVRASQTEVNAGTNNTKFITPYTLANWTGGGGSAASDTAFASSWNGVTTIAPSKNAVYDWAHVFDTDDDGKVNVLDIGAGIPKTDSGGVVSVATAGTDYSVPAGTETLTNKRITARVATLADAATVTPATDSYDGGILTSLSQTTAFAVPTGTPTDFQRYILRIKSTTTRTISFSSSSGGYRGSADLALPTATSGSSLTDYLVFQWNAADSKWDLVGRNFGF